MKWLISKFEITRRSVSICVYLFLFIYVIFLEGVAWN